MRDAPDVLDTILQGSFQVRYWADLYVDDERVLADLPLSDVAPKWSDNGEVEFSCSATVTYTSTWGETISPTSVADWLAPFGSKVALYIEVYVGDEFSVRLLMGWGRLTAVPNSVDTTAPFQGRSISLNSQVELTLQDEMYRIQGDKFITPGTPATGATVYGELARLSDLAVTSSVPDKAIGTTSIIYDTERVKALTDIGAIVDAKPYILPNNTIGLRANTRTVADEVGVLRLGEYGTIEEVGNSLDSAEVYNGVVIQGETDDNTTVVLAKKWITGGPLRYKNTDGTPSPYGRKPYILKSDTIKTAAQANAVIDAWLTKVSTVRGVIVPVTCILDPRVELGDVLRVEREDYDVVGVVKSISIGGSATMNLDLQVLDIQEHDG